MIFRALRAVAPILLTVTAFAWDYEGHRTVSQLALTALPADFPAFVREPANAERIAFLSGEPDRWRNNDDLPIKHFNSPDHYLNLEVLADAGLDAATVSPMRYAFATDFAAGRAAHAGNFPSIDPARNTDRTREWPGFLPWAIAEQYGKLKSAFSYLKTFEESGGTPEEIANARANIVYVMGVMGHYVGDAAQPLHTTKHHNGWVGDNPQNFTKWPRFHSWIDSGFINKSGIGLAPLLPRVGAAVPLAVGATPGGRDPLFSAVMSWLLEQHRQVEPLYVLEKSGALRAEVAESSVEGRAFIEARLLAGGRMLGALWLTAWQQAGPDTFLRAQLVRRQGGKPAEDK
jgi:hypothetical protein